MQVFCGCCKNGFPDCGALNEPCQSLHLARPGEWHKNGALHAWFVRNNMLCKKFKINSCIFNLKAISSLKKLIGIKIFHVWLIINWLNHRIKNAHGFWWDYFFKELSIQLQKLCKAILNKKYITKYYG